MTYTVEFEEGAPAKEIAAADDCLTLAGRLHESADSNRPIGVYFRRPDGESLFLVLGGDVSGMSWFPANYSDSGTGSMSSDTNVNIGEPLDYWLCGHHGQVGPTNAVAITTAFRALEQFLRDGGQPSAAKWVAD